MRNEHSGVTPRSSVSRAPETRPRAPDRGDDRCDETGAFGAAAGETATPVGVGFSNGRRHAEVRS
jgi:hypothetical protein